MDPQAFKKVWVTILKLGLIPWSVECTVVATMSHFLIDLPWMWAFLLGSIIAAVSPAVVVPCLFRLRTKGYGVAKGIPTLIIAVAGIDDAASVAIFGIISSIMFSNEGITKQIAQAPVCIFGGLGFGVLWGCLSKYVPEKGDEYVVPIRTLMLFGGGLVAVFGSEKIGFEGAGPLAVVFAAFTSSYFWTQQGWELEDNPVATAFEIFWMIFEPILFGITGASVKVSYWFLFIYLLIYINLTSQSSIDKGIGPTCCYSWSWYLGFWCNYPHIIDHSNRIWGQIER